MEDIKNFVPSSYNSYGNDDGYGDDYGGGCGDGCGCGYDDGHGRGYGYGYGYGYVNGCGDGCGCGNDDGYGYGSGDGYGCGIKSYNGVQSVIIDRITTFITKIHGNLAKGFTLNDDMTKKECYVVKYQGYFAHGATAKEAEEAAIKKYICSISVEEKITKFIEEHDYNTAYPNSEFFEWHNMLTGSCEFGRKQFCESKHIDPKNGLTTTKAFLEMTKDAYNGNIIKEIIKKYEEESK